jgi:signal transduction histidine kinase
MTVRWDDGLTTVMRWASDPRPAARALVYRQLIDLMAQQRFPKDPQARETALRVLRTVREDIPRSIRLETAQVLGRQRSLPRDLAPAFLGDEPEIAAPVLARLALNDREWRAILPELAPELRAHLCRRQDLPEEIRRLAMMLGSSPLALPPPAVEALVVQPAEPAQVPVEVADPVEIDTSIQDLIERIETYRVQHPQPAALVEVPSADAEEAQVPDEVDVPPPVHTEADIDGQLGSDWRWETDRFATLTFVDRPDAAIPDRVETAAALGQCLLSLISESATAEAIEDCWRRRVPFRNKLVGVDQAPMAGSWYLSGVPVFESRAGLFLGYRGTAHRVLIAAADLPLELRPSQRVMPEPAVELADLQVAPEAAIGQLGELAHEVRTPLTAIMGFAQLIEGQMRGPVDPAYQERAAAIVAESKTMLSTLDAILETDRAARDDPAAMPAPVQPALMIDSLVGKAAQEAGNRGVFLVKRIGLALPDVWTAPDILDTCVDRMIRHHLSLAKPGESVVISVLSEGDDAVRITVRRPVEHADEAAETMVSRLVGLQSQAISARFEAHSPARWGLVVPSIPVERIALAQAAAVG